MYPRTLPTRRILILAEKEIFVAATPQVLDMTYAELKPNGKPMVDPQGRPPEQQGGRPAKSTSAKQIRARARRKQAMVNEELELLYMKPVDQWDSEELARGRPRAKDGTFKGKAPPYIDRAVHEAIVKRFEQVVRTEMNQHTVEALAVVGMILEDDRTDERGKPVVAAGTKLDAAKFLIEHVIGKPKQRVESDISVRLQGLLASVMVNPGDQGGPPQLAQGYIDAPSWEDDDDEEDDDG